MQLIKEYATDKAPKLTQPAQVARNLRWVRNQPKEIFVVFYLNSRNKITSREFVSIGILNQTFIHPREIFRGAILRNSNAIIIAHNHPSGSLFFSDEDESITKRLVEAGNIIGIKVLDHVLVTKTGYISMRDINPNQF